MSDSFALFLDGVKKAAAAVNPLRLDSSPQNDSVAEIEG
jgi:hypothetical protein